MKMLVFFIIAFVVVFLTGSASAASTSLTDLVTGESQNSGLSVPQLPPPEGGSLLQRKILDSQPYVYKTSDRLLREAEISRDFAIKAYEECMVKTTADINNLESTKKAGRHFTVDEVKHMYATAEDSGFYTDEARSLFFDSMENFEQANKQYRAALAAAGDKDYERQARIFESSASMYESLGMTSAQEQVENAAMAARARAAAESLFLPLPAWIAVLAIIGGFLLIQKKHL